MKQYRQLKPFTQKQLLAIKAEFIRQSLAAAKGKPESLAWYDSLIEPWDKNLLTDVPVLVIDYGGSFVRTGVAFSPDGKIIEWRRRPQKEKIIYEYPDAYAFANWFINLTQSLIKNFHIHHVGLIFSQAHQPIRFNGHITAKITSLSKALMIPGLIGKDLGRLYLNALQAKDINLEKLVVLNDTIALALCQRQAIMSLVIGTGANICGLHPQLLNLRNLEAGYFAGVPPALVDASVDLIDRPGGSPMEKQSTGMYQYRLLAYAALFNQMRRSISQEIIKIGDQSASFIVSQLSQKQYQLLAHLKLSRGEKNQLTGLAKVILQNSYQMWAAAVAAVIELNQKKLTGSTISLPVTGGVILNDSVYFAGLKNTIESLVKKKIQLIKVPDPIKGGAVAALMS